jgi:hypothetical protein
LIRLLPPSGAPAWLLEVLREIERAFQGSQNLASYTVGALPKPDLPSRWIFVSADAGGPTPAFNDGTNWRRASDRAIIS